MIYKQLKQEIANLLEIEVSALDENCALVQYGNWDSLVVISALATIDEQFGVLLKGCEIDQCKCLKDIYKLIEEKQAYKIAG